MVDEHHHDGAGGHDHTAGANARALAIAFALTATFLVVEVIGGVMTQSLALLSDAAHMLTDVLALLIALIAMRIARRSADARRTFGYHRFEILAAAFNAMLLFGVAVYILYEAWLRLKAPPEIQSTTVLAIAAVGLVVNVLSMKILASGQATSMNVKGAYLEVWADMIGSIGVIVGALLIKFTGWSWIDSLVAVGIGFWVVPRTWTLLKASVNILLEGVPDDIDLARVEEVVLSVPGVESLHDLHVWALTSGKVSLTVHLVVRPESDAEAEVVPEARRRLAHAFGITHTTLQCERVHCGQIDEAHHFMSPTTPPQGTSPVHEAAD